MQENPENRQQMILEGSPVDEPRKTSLNKMIESIRKLNVRAWTRGAGEACAQFRLQIQAAKAAINHRIIAGESGKKRKTTEKAYNSSKEKSRPKYKSLAASLKPSSLEIHFKKLRAKPSGRDDDQIITERARWRRSRNAKAARRAARSPMKERKRFM